jgi:hypothetical protein
MPDCTLTVLDTTGIQDYVFGSNVLRENVGASELVWRATRLWPFVSVRELGRTNIRPGPLTGDPDDIDLDLHIERDALDAEIVYAGGGNCLVLFANEVKARDFVTRLTKQVLEQAPNLNLVAAHVPVRWNGDPATDDVLAAKVGEVFDALGRKKRGRRVSTPLLGLSTTVACQSTGLPAAGTDADKPGLKPARAAARPLSAEILAKLSAVDAADERLSQPLRIFFDAGFTIPRDFDHFGREAGEISYIAVVHADGNSMGQRVEAIQAAHPSSGQNRAYINAMRGFSADVERASRQALEEVSRRLLRHWDPSKKRDEIVGRTWDEKWGDWIAVGRVPLNEEKHRLYIPFRPIVFGGDDLTFVTDGRLGLPLATAYLEAFERAMNARPTTKDILAGAGVAIVKAHYPFARAYELAEGLCKNAKKEYHRQYSALDWHFAAAGLFGTIDEIRKSQYTVPASRVTPTARPQSDGRRETYLEMRPLLLHANTGHPEEWRAWPNLARVTKTLLVDEAWAGKHNKVIGLRNALREGPGAVERFRVAYSLKKLPELAPNIAKMQETGWDGQNRCGYFDAVEALDLYLPLDWGEEDA